MGGIKEVMELKVHLRTRLMKKDLANRYKKKDLHFKMWCSENDQKDNKNLELKKIKLSLVNLK